MPSSHRLRPVRTALFARRSLGATLFALMAPCLPAANLTWNGGVSGDWVNDGAGWIGGNWSNANPDSATFAGAAPTSVTVNSGGVTAGNLTFSSGNYTLGGTGTLTFSSTTVDIASGLVTTVNSALAGTTGLTKTGAGTLALSGTNKAFTGAVNINGGAIQIASAAAGALGTNANTTVNLNGGALHANFAANSNVGYAISVGASGGELRNLGTDSGRWQMVSNTISGAGTLTLSFGSNNTRFNLGTTTQTGFSGKWIVNSGGNNNRFADVGGSSNFGTGSGDDFITLQNTGTLLLRTGVTLGGATQGITLGTGGGRLNVGGSSTVTVAGKISGVAGNALTVGLDNSAVLVLSNTANAFSGDLSTVANNASPNNTSVLRLGAAGVIPDGSGRGNVSIGSNTAIDLNGFGETINGLSGSGTVRNDSATAATLTVGGNNTTSTFTGTFGAGTGVTHLAKTGTGVLTLSGTNSYAGGTTVSEGALQLSEAGNRTYAGQLSGAGVLLKSGAGTLTLAHAENSIGRLRLDGGAITVTGGLTSSGAGTVAVADFGGATLNVAGGNVTIGGTREFVVGLQSTGAVNVSSGALTLGSGLTIGIGSHAGTSFGANGDGTLGVSGGTVTIQGSSAQSVLLARPRTDNGSTGSFTGTINLTGGVLETARGFAEGANTTGGTKTSTIAFNGGTLRALGANTNWIDASVDTVSLASGGGVIDTNGHDVAINRAITGAGALTKMGGGTLTLGGANAFAGGLVISGGTVALGESDVLAGAGGLTLAGGTLAAGTFTNAPGALTLGAGINTITLGAGAQLAFADSSAIVWGLNTLSISGTFLDGASIRFGDSAAGLHVNQLAAITVNGQAAFIDSFGYLTAVPEPSAFALIAGLAGFGCTTLRRRRRI